jgi:poly(A) polymerase
VADIDIATTTTPEATTRRAEAAGFKAVPTGIEHGTVTVIAEGRPYEVTTLRDDVETDGRRATVVFGRDWQRRRGTARLHHQCALCEADGTVVDLVGGLRGHRNRTIRFIGDAETRIREDYLRILRFFRFFALVRRAGRTPRG